MPEASARRRYAFFALIAAALLGGAAWLQWGAEWVTEEIDIGYSEEARRNQYLAAEHFLRNRGVETETVSGLALLDDLPPTDDVLIISSSRRSLSERRRQALDAWVRDGGHLILVATETWDAESESSRDLLMDGLGGRLYDFTDIEELEEDADASDAEPAPTVELEFQFHGTEPAPTVELEFQFGPDQESEDDDGPGVETEDEDDRQQIKSFGEFFAAINRRYACKDDPAWLALAEYGESGTDLVVELALERHVEIVEGTRFTIDSEHSSQLVNAEVGNGHLTIATSLHPWRNEYIHCHDHAFVLWVLTSGRGKVWLLHDPDVPGFATLIASSFPIGCLTLGLLALLWAASRTLRFGREAPGLDAERRDLLEHLEAAASFGWRADRLEPTLEEMRSMLVRDLTDDQGHLRGPVGELSEDARKAIEGAINGPLPTNRTDLLHYVQLFQSVRVGG